MAVGQVGGDSWMYPCGIAGIDCWHANYQLGGTGKEPFDAS
jgi:hypothetical protein